MDSVYKVLRKINAALLKAESVFIGIGSIFLTVLVLIAVVCRYALYVATPWADELARFLFVWIAFVGAGYVTGTWNHVDVQLVDSILEKKSKDPKRAIGIAIKISKAISLVVLCVFAVFYLQYLLDIYPAKSTALAIPMHIPYASALTGLILMAIQCLCVLILPEGDSGL